ncbi:hypothetical protein ACHAXS_009988, partial [Conticribra weissflogii]
MIRRTLSRLLSSKAPRTIIRDPRKTKPKPPRSLAVTEHKNSATIPMERQPTVRR